MTSEMLFEKRVVAELTDAEMMNIDGGTTPVCAWAAGAAAASSTYCAGVAIAGAIFVAGAVVGYLDN